ncbi:DUF5376 family protein [Acinetobacter junii]|uniref:DUF5376 family protein n=1 Tax=Acinetobacter junii TaxID=40215 RepID=UPI0002CF9B06|nr:DUF5376 family protein [Acinetobacter junii]ENV50200.1 hypothetical protein F953_02323 [Acinetobacter junii CIP 107470 = MTCC 11364]
MSLIFYYIKYPELIDLIATIKSDGFGGEEEEIIASYLIDNGGSSLESYINLLEENVFKLESLSIINADISSNSYGAEIFGNIVKIYCFYDEEKEYEVNRFDLLKITRCWLDFVQKKPIENYQEKHDL